jgi:ATP-dependent helicase/nuclease subunit B
MKIVVLPYGNAGWKKKRGLLEDVLSVRKEAPYLYNDVLIIVPSKRMKRLYGRLFLEFAERHGSAALVQPDVQTLDDFFRKLYARLAGPLPLGENSRLVLLEGIVKDRLSTSSPFSLSPDLLAPSLSSALADMIEQLAGADVGPDELAVKLRGADFSDKPQVKLLVDVYAGYNKALREGNLTDPAGVRAYLRDRFDPSWLSPYRLVIIEGIEDVSAIEGDILRKTAACCDCTYVVDAPSAEMLNRAGEFHPLRIVRDTLGRIGALPPGAGPAPDGEQGFLASALFSDRPFSETAKKAPDPRTFAKTINLLSAVNTREEVTFIAGRVKQSLKRGTPPDSILVAFPALDAYGPLVEEIFSDSGIPYNRALGRQLSTSPLTTAVISLLHSVQEDFSGPSLLRIFSSPFLRFGGNRLIVSGLDRIMRDRRITGGRLKLLSALNTYQPAGGGADMLTGPLNELFTALEPFAVQEPLPLAAWMDRLGHLIAWSGLGAGVAAIEGPLSVNRQAYRKLQETLESLAHAGDLFPEFKYTFREWLFLLKKTFMHTRFQVPPEDEGGVQILGLRESYGHPWQEIYFGGLVDSEFPQRLPQNIFLPEHTLETLGVRTFEHERLMAALHFYRFLLMADTITLTYPENEGDRPVVPSPFLEELTSLKKADLLNRGIEKTSGIQFSMKIADACSISGLAKSISLSGNLRGLQEVLSMNIKGMSGIRSGVSYLPREPAPIATPLEKREFRVTELELYINCPYDYYVSYVLGMVPLEEVTEDISPMDRGSKVHMILRDFYLSWDRAVTRESRDEARALLRHLADASFDREADTFRNRREKEIFLSVMAERFLDAEEEFWKQGMRPAYLERTIERYRLILPDGKEVELTAKIDRIDVDENGNFIIVDYKTGRYPLPKMNADQDIFQLPVYAVMARQAIADAAPALKIPVGLAYYDLAGKTGGGARDVVLYNSDALADQPSSRPKASPRSAGEFEAILEQGIDKACKAVEGIIRGEFTSLPRDENRCRYCPNEMMCENER